MSTFYLDYEGGNDANDGLSYANRWKTFTSGATAARIAPGDTIRVMASPDATSLGISATWTNESPTVTLASALNVLITDCESVWTASPNVTCTADNGTYRTGTKSSRMDIAAGFTTGLAAYFGLGATLDYSAYQGITFWIRTSATVAASTLSIRLCSDAVGAVSVDTLVIPAIPVAATWTPVYVDKGSALGNSIQSIALYCDADPGTVSVYLDNFSTVKAAGSDNLALPSLIGKNTAGEYWWPIRSISGTTITLDHQAYATPSSNAKGYSGTSESVTTYKRETIKTTVTSGSLHAMQDNGSSGSLITYSGGWNRTDMTTQTGETYYDGQSYNGTCIDFNGKTFSYVDKIHTTRYATGFSITGADCSLGTVQAIACASAGVSIGSGATRFAATSLVVVGGVTYGVTSSANGVVIGTIDVRGFGSGASDNAVYLYGRAIKVSTLTVKNYAACGYRQPSTSANNTITTLTLDRGTNGVIQSVDCENFYIGTATVSNMTTGVSLVGGLNFKIGTLSVTNCTTGIDFSLMASSSNLIIQNLTTSGNTTALNFGPMISDIRVLNCTFGEGSPVTFSATAGYYSGRVVFQNYDGVSGDHRTYYGHATLGATIFSGTSYRHTSSGLGYRFTILDSTYITSNFPAQFPVARLALQSGSTTTVHLWAKRSATSASGTLRCRGGQLSGITNDVTASITAGAGVWEQLSIALTPSANGIVEIDFTAYGATNDTVDIHEFLLT